MRDGQQTDEADNRNAKWNNDKGPALLTFVGHVCEEDSRASTDKIDGDCKKLGLGRSVSELEDDGGRGEAESVNANAVIGFN